MKASTNNKKSLMREFLTNQDYWRNVATREADGREDLADDIIQEAYINLKGHVDRNGDFVKGEPAPFIYATIVNAHRIHYRRNKRYEPAEKEVILEKIVNENRRALDKADSYYNTPDGAYINRQALLCLDEAIKKIPGKKRQQYIRLWVDAGYDTSEALKLVKEKNLNYNTFKETIRAAKAYIKDFFKTKGY